MAPTIPSKPLPQRSNTTSSLTPPLTAFTNCQVVLNGELLPQDLYFSPTTGLITPNYYYLTESVTRIDLGGAIVAPGFLEVQSNGMGGVHFSHLASVTTVSSDSRGSMSSTVGASLKRDASEVTDEDMLSRVATMEVQAGVTGFYATIPTVQRHRWPSILARLQPRSFVHGADLLGAHVEGPYLCPAKKGAHNEAYFVLPSDAHASPADLYGASNLSITGSVKMITLAPELAGSTALIGSLRETHPHITISLGHSNASYTEAQQAVSLGARALTHTFNAMPALHHREPGLAGLITSSVADVYFSIIPDGVHVHPAICALAFRANPRKCVLITDSIELAGLPDGVYAGHVDKQGQIAGRQRKEGNTVTLEGTNTLVGSCLSLDECVRNLIRFAGCSLAEAVRCVTENVADMLGQAEIDSDVQVSWGGGSGGSGSGSAILQDDRDTRFDIRKRGVLEPGRRADFAILNADAEVLETWMGGERVWKRA